MAPVEMDESTGDQKSGMLMRQMMLNMQRDASGTSWQPSDNPMLMRMSHDGDTMSMLHWNAFADYDYQGGKQKQRGFYSQNWLMFSSAAPVLEGKPGQGIVQARAMFSLEPLTVGKHGYPLLFQVGETYQGEPLVDRQHPHDLFMELSMQYMTPLGRVTSRPNSAPQAGRGLNGNAPDTWLRIYAAPVGEPALGSVAFPHRYSAFLNPESPLGHHEMDSTHVSFGVATVGLIHKNWQLEGSIFNGHEPDENRYDFDFGRWNSYSGRLSWMPTPNWALQISHGYLTHPEALEPGNLNRSTASIMHMKTLPDGWVASTLAFGHNYKTGPDENAVLLESTWNFKRKNYIFGRIENASRHGLLENKGGHGGDEHNHNVVTLGFGAARELFRFGDIPVNLGAMLRFNLMAKDLQSDYGHFPLSFHVFLQTMPLGM